MGESQVLLINARRDLESLLLLTYRNQAGSNISSSSTLGDSLYADL